MKKYSFDAPEHVIAAIDYRGEADGTNRASAIWRTLARYLELVNRSKAELAKQFSDTECALIIDATNGTMLNDTMSIQLLPYGVADAIEIDGLDSKWNVDGQALMEKLNATSYADRMAIADAIIIWWHRHKENENPKAVELFQKIAIDEDTTMII